MTRTGKWIAGSAAAVAVLLCGLALLAHRLLPSDEELAAQVSARFEQATGVGLRIGAAHWSLRPVPVVVLSDLATAQAQPITVGRIVIRPQLAGLWRRQIGIDEIEVSGAVLPRASVRALRGSWQPDDAAGLLGGPWTLAEIPLGRLRLQDLTWIDRRGIALAYDAEVRFDAGWRPREGEARRPGVSPEAVLRIEREGDADRWRALIDVGGGTWNGSAVLQTLDNGSLRLTGELAPQGVDIAGMVGAFGRSAAVEGKLNGRTQVEAEGENAAALLRGLRTRTRFSVKPAVVKGFDLARAARTASTERGGQTVFDELTGTLETQVAEDGMLLRYTGLRGRSGLLTASGSATVFNRKLDGEAAIDLVDGVVGLPLRLGGTLDQPKLSLTGGALTGAAIGTAVLPGVGTAIGARIGQQVEKIFGDDDSQKKKTPR
ncbi:MAG: hypothetical protein WKG52_03730 [Variovorax sp.]